MIHACFSHDIDRIDKTYQYLTKPLKALKNRDFSLFLKRLTSPLFVKNPYWGFDRILEIESQHNIRSTCFFLIETIKPKISSLKTWKLGLGRYDIHDKRIVEVIQQLDQGGWEIGLHGSFRSYNNSFLLKQEKNKLEAILGHEVIGIRQHYLNFDETTWQIQSSLGFLYDSTWGMANSVGFKGDKVNPFFPIKDSLFCEIPLTIMDGPFSSTPDRWDVFFNIIDVIDKNDSFLVINYHNNNLDTLDFPGYLDDYVKMIKVLKEKGAKFMTLGQAYRYVVETKL